MKILMMNSKSTGRAITFLKFTHFPLYPFSVDYTDCFGRTRKILKKDLDKKKKEDADLSSVAESRTDQLNPNREESSPEPDRSKEENLSSDNDDTESFIGPDVGLQFLKQREEWQEQEELNAQRESTHYADVLFNGESQKNETISMNSTKSLFAYTIYSLL